jgi:hypothetical protein
MGQINYGRLLLGGIVAGIIIAVVDAILSGWVLASQFNAALTERNLPPTGTGQIVWFVIYALIVGIVAVWIYAGFRPRFGAGPRTAVIAGVTTWVIATVFGSAYPVTVGLLPIGLAITVSIIGLIQVVVATWAGAALYQEQ